MNERPTRDFAAGRSWHDEERSPANAVDRLEEPSRRHSPRLRAVAAGVLAALVGGAVLAGVLTHDGGDAAASRAPTPPAPYVQRHRLPAAAAPPTDGITAAGRIAGTVSPGDGLVFDVTLRSSRFFSLHPCPSYTVTFGTRTSTRPLGCAQVPYLASLVRPNGQVTDFQPVLPAGTDVVFRVRVAVPDALGRQHVLWTLNGTRPRPRLSGIVNVTSPGPG